MKQHCEARNIWLRSFLCTLFQLIVLFFIIKVEFAYGEDLENSYE